MVSAEDQSLTRGKWMALAAALLGWMFDGLEQGLFPLVARPALLDLLGPSQEGDIGLWFSVATAGFLVGAATGGVLFGWLGDRIGRVRAMMLTVLTYAVFSGLCGLATTAWQIAVLRFCSALGMGGEWSLGVALVMEIWPEKSRALLAGLIGAAANVGFLLIAVVGLGLTTVLNEMQGWLLGIGLSESWVQTLVANNGWRLLMLFGAAPALLTFFIRLFVPESERWQREQKRGATSSWATRDLLGVAVGALGACLIIYLWAGESPWPIRLPGTAFGLLVATAGYMYPVVRYLQRSDSHSADPRHTLRPTLSRMLLGACLGGVALTSTWGASQWIPLWADQLAGSSVPQARSYSQIASALGAIVGTMTGAMLGKWLGRRIIYSLLCLSSLGSAMVLYRLNSSYGPWFLPSVFLVGCTTASFYGWLPLYLPELFRTGVRATGQGFSYNFGRILAAMGVLQTGNLMKDVYQNDYPQALSVVSLVYLIGLALIWLAPETYGKALPE
jgi:SHS family sialic acid transporter-like MFS transporter